MKYNIDYDANRPLMRLEKGDKAYIRISRFGFNVKDELKYNVVPDGEYEAIVIEPYRLECPEYPVLSGKYNYWRGDKRACSGLIYADEKKQHEKYS